MPVYIAINTNENNEMSREIIIARDQYWSPKIRELFDALCGTCQPDWPRIEAWYHDDYTVQKMGVIGKYTREKSC